MKYPLICFFLLGSLSTLTAAEQHITVKKGDTLWGIARSAGTSVSQLRKLNGMQSGVSIIQVGQKLRVPGASKSSTSDPGAVNILHVVKSGETLWGIAREYRVPLTTLRQWNKLTESDQLRVGQKLLVSRASGKPAPAKPAVAPKPGNKPAVPKVAKKPEPTKHAVQIDQKVMLKDFAESHDMTVDQINALNGLSLSGDTMLAAGSELYVAD